MTRKIRSAIENSSAIHKPMLKGSQIGLETNKGEIFGNQIKGSSLMSNHIKCDFENVLKENKNNTAKLHSLKPNKLKSNVKKPSNELHDKKWHKNGRQKYSKTIKPYRLIKLPYGCVWNGNEGRFAIRVFSPKLKNGIKNTIHPRRIVNLPYGCVWNGKEGRFAVRMVSPKVKNDWRSSLAKRIGKLKPDFSVKGSLEIKENE